MDHFWVKSSERAQFLHVSTAQHPDGGHLADQLQGSENYEWLDKSTKNAMHVCAFKEEAAPS